MKKISFEVKFKNKRIKFNSSTSGLVVNKKEYTAGDDGVLIYNKTIGLKANTAICQFSTNTSTLIPALRILGISYNPYFDKHEVVESQNDITYYRKKSKLAAFYNRFSTDGVDLENREKIIRKAVNFLLVTSSTKDFLPEELLKGIQEDVVVLGKFKGVNIYKAHIGLPHLKKDIGIHIGIESIMLSTPLDKYSKKVFELAKQIEDETGLKGAYKKNRVRFEKKMRVLKILGIHDKH